MVGRMELRNIFFLVELQQVFSNSKFVCANKLSMERKRDNCHEEIA